MVYNQLFGKLLHTPELKLFGNNIRTSASFPWISYRLEQGLSVTVVRSQIYVFFFSLVIL